MCAQDSMRSIEHHHHVLMLASFHLIAGMWLRNEEDFSLYHEQTSAWVGKGCTYSAPFRSLESCPSYQIHMLAPFTTMEYNNVLFCMLYSHEQI